MTSWKAQKCDGTYAIQFETDRWDLYDLIEKACQKAIDIDRVDRQMTDELMKRFVEEE